MRLSPLRRGAAASALAALALAVFSTTLSFTSAQAAEPRPVDPVSDVAHMAEAYGRISGPGGQLQNPRYLPALVQQTSLLTATQLLAQAADPLRLAVTPALLVPGWNVGNPLRAGWAGTRGRERAVAFTNRFGARLQGTLYAPLANARDPYTGTAITGPYPAVVITPGSVGGSQGMYRWLAQDLAERGYLVLLFDVQGEGTSETLPHTSGQAFPFCNPFGGTAGDPDLGTGETTPCPGVPFQQLSNFTTGTVDALDFLTSTPARPYANPGSAGTRVDAFNPWWRLWDRSPLPRPTAPGRTARIAVVGHSMGAFAVSRVQGYDKRVATAIALDKLGGNTGGSPVPTVTGVPKPVVPALGIQSEYGFTVTPSVLSGGSSLMPAPSPQGVDPDREKATGFDAWRAAGVDSMVYVPRASTHLEYTDIPLVLPASRYGQDVTSALAQRWLGHYLRGESLAPLLATRMRYLEPQGAGVWKPIVLDRAALASDRFCSAYWLTSGSRKVESRDWTGVGC